MIKRIERADGARYQVYARAAGRKVYVGTYESKREAQEAEEEHRVTQRKIERGELAPEMDLKRTLSEALDEWLASLKARGARSHEGVQRPRQDLHQAGPGRRPDRTHPCAGKDRVSRGSPVARAEA